MVQVSMMAARALLAGVESAGAPREQFLQQAGLSAAQLSDVTARIELDDYRRAIRAAIAVTGDAALGLHMGERASLSTFDVLGLLAEHSRSLREALSLSAQYARIVTVGPKLEVTEDGDACTTVLTRLRGEAPEVLLVAEFSTAALLSLIRRFVGEGAQVRRAFFAYEAPAHRDEYARVFGGREQFAHESVGLEIDREWLDREQPFRSPDLHALLRARADLLLAKVEQASSAAERVRGWLGARALEARPTMEMIARDLGMSARSLRRRLQREGVPFYALLDEALAARAKQMLADTRHSVKETAFAMGFRTPAAFARAFKRWTGRAPSAHRAAR